MLSYLDQAQDHLARPLVGQVVIAADPAAPADLPMGDPAETPEARAIQSPLSGDGRGPPEAVIPAEARMA